MSKPTVDEEIYDLNVKYQVCLNTYYDKMIEGKLFDVKNICTQELSKIKEHPIFKEMAKNFDKYLKEHKINLE